MPKRPPPRRSKGYQSRRIEVKDPIERFLIVCEGEKTEPNYSLSFRVPTRPRVIEVVGLGRSTVKLVKRAIELKEEAEQEQRKYDQVWCVLDRDIFPAGDFNDALELAGVNDIQVAYSNEAFELWYVLHFQYCDTALTRLDYVQRLNRLLGRPYEKNSNAMYDRLLSLQSDAIRNAKTLLKQYDPSNPAHDNPSTTVHLLVEQLNRFVNRFDR